MFVECSMNLCLKLGRFFRAKKTLSGRADRVESFMKRKEETFNTGVAPQIACDWRCTKRPFITVACADASATCASDRLASSPAVAAGAEISAARRETGALSKYANGNTIGHEVSQASIQAAVKSGERPTQTRRRTADITRVITPVINKDGNMDARLFERRGALCADREWGVVATGVQLR